MQGKGSAQDSQEAQGSDLDPEMQAAMNKIRKLDRILFEKTQVVCLSAARFEACVHPHTEVE